MRCRTCGDRRRSDRRKHERQGIRRYADALSHRWTRLARVAVDISGRYLVGEDRIQPSLGEMDTEMFRHWFHSFAQTAGLTLHIETLYGTNNHHIAEAVEPGRALRN